MRLVKTINLAVVAAFAAMTFVGPSPASAFTSAVVLCKNPELVCENRWPNPTTIVVHAINPRILSSVGTIECEKSLTEITLLNTLAILILAHILSSTLEGNCHLGSTKCTVTVEQVGGISFTHGINSLEWRGVFVPLPLGETSMNTKKNIKCGFLINCTYEGGEETELTVTNNGEGVATIIGNETPLKRSAGFCPEVSKLHVALVGLGADLYLES